MLLKSAEPAHLSAILSLLVDSDLPTSGVEEHLTAFVIAESDGDLVGAGGLEIYGRTALLRSVAVARAHRGKGIATGLCARLEAEAARRGVDRLYLLTDTAEAYFEERAYAVLPRSDAPAEIASCEEFTTLCPETAVLMSKSLEGEDPS